MDTTFCSESNGEPATLRSEFENMLRLKNSTMEMYRVYFKYLADL